MNLPDLALQIVYGRLAWALVVAAGLLAWWPRVSRRALAGVTALCVALMALPGAASPAYTLVLAFQYPSGMLAGCALLALYARWRGETVAFALPWRFALPLFVAGTLLYLDAFGVLALGLYYGGFGAMGVPVLACLGLAACAWAVIGGHAQRGVLAPMAGLLLYSLLRLPTGNLWDALLDPLVWTWALVSVLAALPRQLAALRARPALPAAPDDAIAVPVAAIEQLQTVRE